MAPHRCADHDAALNGNIEPCEDYLLAFTYGLPPHALGLERWTAWLLVAADVRETTLFPRDRHRLAP